MTNEIKVVGKMSTEPSHRHIVRDTSGGVFRGSGIPRLSRLVLVGGGLSTWEVLQVIISIIGAIILLVLMAKVGFMNILRGVAVALIIWFVVRFTFDSFSFFDRFFECRDVYVPLAGMSKDCDYKNIPMIIGAIVGTVGAIALKMNLGDKLDEMNKRLDEEERRRSEQEQETG